MKWWNLSYYVRGKIELFTVVFEWDSRPKVILPTIIKQQFFIFSQFKFPVIKMVLEAVNAEFR